MNLSKDQLEMLERLGAHYFTFREAAIVIEVSENDLKKLIADSTSEAHKRYYKGKFTSDLELRESIMKMAKRGSNPAQKMMVEIREQTNLGNL